MKYTKEILLNSKNSLDESIAVHFNKVWNAYDFSRHAWKEIGLDNLFRNVWGKGIDMLHKENEAALEAINAHDKVRLAQIAATLADYGQRFKNTATRFYEHESCWNLRLPKDLTKVLGHEYTFTEWATQQTDMLGDMIKMVAKDYQRALA